MYIFWYIDPNPSQKERTIASEKARSYPIVHHHIWYVAREDIQTFANPLANLTPARTILGVKYKSNFLSTLLRNVLSWALFWAVHSREHYFEHSFKQTLSFEHFF